MDELQPFLHRTRIAYFSMEIALRPEMHTYSGGLGVLAGDTARTCADLGLPVAFVSLVARAGYVLQEIDASGRQVTRPNPWQPEQWTQPLGAMVAVRIEGRDVWIRSWLHLLVSPLGSIVPVLLLDTNVEQNSPSDREITDQLYGGDQVYRLKQEIVLGIGGALMLRALGFDIETYHLNEGHAALLTLHLLRGLRRHGTTTAAKRGYDHDGVRWQCVFTTHTPVEAAFDRFPYPLVESVLGPYIERDELEQLAGPDALNMTRLALNLSDYVNGVSRAHADTTRLIFPGYQVHAITNGVHAPTWTHASFARLYNAHLPHWGLEPEVLARVDQLPDEMIWSAHQEAKQDLIARVKERTQVALRPDLPTIGFARRMTEYKRPTLLFSDIARLTEIARKHPFQVVFAGMAHPRDEHGKDLIAIINQRVHELAAVLPIVFLPNYDMRVAACLVAGVDIWLNTPLPPLEASGTSGMKAALNGVLNLSVLDGWWSEAHIEGVTGWAVGDGSRSHAEDLYAKLEHTVLPLHEGDRTRWIWMMKQAISRIGAHFNSHRMIRRYVTEAYMR
ncbi:MAG: alpha-glucan phosphorylase [Alphaproteobacteria bacterium]|nr:MAG: alpha-glucan phosphorylase [Alphaproteobacteria bacterium]